MRQNMCWAIVTAILVVSSVAAQERYAPPGTPTLLDPDAPSFVPLDVEVDAFVRIPQARARFNVDGSGLAVVVIDTGINPQHLSFQGRIVPGENFSTQGAAADTTDRDGHGSNVSGIIMGAALLPSVGVPTGVALNAKVVPLKVFPGGQFEKINDALQWVIDERDRIKNEENVAISVVNMSLGNATNNASLDMASLPSSLQRQRTLIRQLRDLNIVVTVAAGNNYTEANPEQGMGFPAICPETTSVGAVFDTEIPRDPSGSPIITYRDGGKVFSAHPGRLTVFTQRLGGASGGDFRTDIFSPGFIVTSAGPVPPSGSGQDPTRTRTTQDGTSQATPVTSGVVLLLQQHFRNLMQQLGREDSLPSVDLVEECLRDGGKPIEDVEDDTAAAMDNVKSCGAQDLHRIDALSALSHLTDRLQSDLQSLQIELLRAESSEGQTRALEASTILGTKAQKSD